MPTLLGKSLLRGLIIGCLLLVGCGTPNSTPLPATSTPSITPTPDPDKPFPTTENSSRQRLELSSGTTLYYVLVTPDKLPETPAPLVIFLHAAGPANPTAGKDMLTALVEPALRDLGAIYAAPACPSSNWNTDTSEQAIQELLDQLLATYPIDPGRVILTGYSMGGRGTWYLAARNQDRFSVAIPISGSPQADSDEFTWTIAVYAIHSRDDGVLHMPFTEQTVEALQAQGARATLKAIEGPTHSQYYYFAQPLREAIPWILETWEGQ